MLSRMKGIYLNATESFNIKNRRKLKYFLRIWLRYVDDVLAIFDMKKADITILCHCLLIGFPLFSSRLK